MANISVTWILEIAPKKKEKKKTKLFTANWLDCVIANLIGDLMLECRASVLLLVLTF